MSETSYRSVRGLERGLAVLHTVNALSEPTSIEVARLTLLPRPTVHRLLETLRRGSYLYRSGLRDAYRFSLKVKSLSDGSKGDDWITEIAEPSSIAVPIMHRKRAIACVNIVWIDSALKFETAAKRYLPMSQKAAARIEDEYRRMVGA